MNKAITYIISYQPYAMRSENCAIGAVVFKDNGSAKVHLGAQLKKVVALDPAINLVKLRSDLAALSETLNNKDTWDVYKRGFGPFRFSEKAGYFMFSSEEEYEFAIESLLHLSVEPRKQHSLIRRKPQSRLFVDLKNAFKGYGWLGKNIEEIEKRKIVTHYPISIEDQLYAEFAIKDKKFHLIETVDFRTGKLSSKKIEAQGKALVFDIAKDVEPLSEGTIIVAANDFQEIKSSMKILKRYATNVAAFDSPTDMNYLFKIWAKAMGRPELPLPPVKH